MAGRAVALPAAASAGGPACARANGRVPSPGSVPARPGAVGVVRSAFAPGRVGFIGMTNEAAVGMSPRSSKTDVLQGTLDLMVLRTLELLGAQHGYAIAARLEQVSSGALQVNMGTLYPALMRLEQRGLVKGTWGTTDTNRKARFYALTAGGRRQLAKDKRAWDRMAGIIHTLLHGEG
jgi:PadR family transcriptional regulator, regulatory protein PadR